MPSGNGTLDSQMRVEEAQFCYMDVTTYRTITDPELATVRQEYITALLDYLAVLKVQLQITHANAGVDACC